MYRALFLGRATLCPESVHVANTYRILLDASVLRAERFVIVFMRLPQFAVLQSYESEAQTRQTRQTPLLTSGSLGQRSEEDTLWALEPREVPPRVLDEIIRYYLPKRCDGRHQERRATKRGLSNGSGICDILGEIR